MEITLSLSNTEGALLKTLAPRGNARKGDYLGATAKSLLVASMKREARLHRIDSGQVFAVALTEAVQRRKEGTM